MITVEFRASGYDYREEDRNTLNIEFAEVGYIRADGHWAPAAGPPIELAVILTFFGQALASVVLERILESTWIRFRNAWKKYRNKRKTYSDHEPELGSIIIRSDDLEIRINMPIAPENFDLNSLVQTIVDRLASNRLPKGSIRQVSLPSRKEDDGHWERVCPEEYSVDDNDMVWWLQGSSVDGPWFFYDASEDLVLSKE